MTREQIDAAIRKHADTETLYDQPYEDESILRVCGPFTVESLSPHRVLPGEAPGPATEAATPGDFVQTILDTDYESFFVRHAYFCGAGDPYEKLQRALEADIDEGEWQKLYSTESMPFDKPATGKLAVKVINHYGDEVMKVYSL